MITRLIERAEALAIVGVAQLYAERRFELVVASTNAAFIEAERERGEYLVGIRVGNFRRRRDLEKLSRKGDLRARRRRLVVHDVEYAVGAPGEGRLDCLGDVEDVDAVRHVSGLGDALRRSTQEPQHRVLPRT